MGLHRCRQSHTRRCHPGWPPPPSPINSAILVPSCFPTVSSYHATSFLPPPITVCNPSSHPLFHSLTLPSLFPSLPPSFPGSFDRAISMFRTSYSIVAVARASVPDQLALVWICQYAPSSSSYAPFYVSAAAVPLPYSRWVKVKGSGVEKGERGKGREREGEGLVIWMKKQRCVNAMRQL